MRYSWTMAEVPEGAGLFAAQLRFWRRKRGQSQLDLSVAADVSARHISFLETGRAKPSEAMVLRLGKVLGLPLRERNTLLAAAGFAPAFAERREVPAAIQAVLDDMLRRFEPCPVVVMDRRYNVLQANAAALALFAVVFAEPTEDPPNMLHALFDPKLARPFVRDWEALARVMLTRLHERALLTGDAEMRSLIAAMQAYPGVPANWREPDFSADDEPVQLLRLALPGGLELAFTMLLTRFSESRNVALDELVIETYLPADPATERFCGEFLQA